MTSSDFLLVCLVVLSSTVLTLGGIMFVLEYYFGD